MKRIRIIRIIGAITVWLVMALPNNTFGNNAKDNFLTTAELQSEKNAYIDAVRQLNEKIDQVITNGIENSLKDLMLGNDPFFDKIYPVGIIIVGDEKPKYGNWVAITPRGALTVGTTTHEFGTCEKGWAQKQKVTLGQTVIPDHGVKDLGTIVEDAGEHTHAGNGLAKVESAKVQGAYNVRKEGSGDWKSTTAASHTHTFLATGIVKSAEHAHELSVIEDLIYRPDVDTIQPAAFVVKLWKRIA